MDNLTLKSGKKDLIKKTTSLSFLVLSQLISLSAQASTNTQTVYCGTGSEHEKDDFGSTFYVDGKQYIIVDNETIHDSGLIAQLQEGEIHFCTSRVTDMKELFAGNKDFNQDIGDWDVGQVTTMTSMFAGANSFNRNINSWDVSQVKDMRFMFSDNLVFDQPLDHWQTSNVRHFELMFSGMYTSQGTVFNQDISNWDVSSAISFNHMFANNKHFNQPLNGWGLTFGHNEHTTLEFMFQDATSFNQDLDQWNVDLVASTRGMFEGASSFNGNLSTWRPSHLQDARSMFHGATSFNSNPLEGPDHSIKNWNPTSLEHVNAMFAGALSLHDDISQWDLIHIDPSVNGDFCNNAPNLTPPEGFTCQ